MAENEKPKKKDSFAKRSKRAYRHGYINGYDDRDKLGTNGNRFFGTIGYGRGYKDRKKIDTIHKRVEKYKKQS